MGNITDAKKRKKSTASAWYSLRTRSGTGDSWSGTRDVTVPPAPLSTILDSSKDGVDDVHPDRVEVEGSKEILVRFYLVSFSS